MLCRITDCAFWCAGWWTLVGVVLGVLSCRSPSEPPPPALNPNIVKVGEYYRMGVWPQPHLLYATPPLDRVLLDAQLNALRDTTLIPNGTPAPIFIEASDDGGKLLYVETPLYPRPGYWGPLYELEVATGQRRLLRDSTWAVSSARYLPGSDRWVVFYSYGRLPWNPSGPVAGYYVLDLQTLKDSLLFAYVSPAGPKEIFNGFDISPDGQTLLIPLNHYPIGYPRAPQIIAFDLQTGRADTLSWRFSYDFLWLRFSPDGRQLLYGTYPFGVFDYTSAGWTEIGVIDMRTGERRVLETTTYFACASMDLFPRWSPDGRHIVYSSAPVLCPEGAIGYYSLYILKNVN